MYPSAVPVTKTRKLPEITALPVYGKPVLAGTFKANDAVVANEAEVANDDDVANDADVANEALVANDAVPNNEPVNEVALTEPVTTNGVEILTVVPLSVILEFTK